MVQLEKWPVSTKTIVCCIFITIGVLVVENGGAIEKPKVGGLLHRHKRVVGGTSRPNVSFPAYAPITRGKDNRDWICSSTVISQSWVLTSAQCLDTWNAQNYYVWPKYLEGGNRSIQVSQVIKYPRYSRHDKNRANDLMLLRLKEPINGSIWGLLAANASTPAETEKWYEGKGIVVGFGKTDQSIQTLLLFGEVPFVKAAECNKAYDGIFNLTVGQVCTGDRDIGGISPCGSDAGGSLYKLTEGAQITVAISTLVGPGPCGAVEYPAVYTKVAPYISWIKKYVPDVRTTDDPVRTLAEPMKRLLSIADEDGATPDPVEEPETSTEPPNENENEIPQE